MHTAPIAAAHVVRFHAPLHSAAGVEKPWLHANLQRLGPAAYTLAPPGVQRAYAVVLTHSDRRLVTRPVVFSQGLGAEKTWAIAQQDDTTERVALYDWKGRYLGRAESLLRRTPEGAFVGSLPRTFIPA
jgi:hypothetical protein